MYQFEKNLNSRHKYIIISAFLLIIGIVPYVITLIYVLPVADDFCYANDIVQLGGYNLSGIFNMVKRYYQNWQGVYFGIALGGAINPMCSIGASGIKIVLLCVIVLSICIISIFINQLCLVFYSNREVPVIFFISLVLVGCFNTSVAKELFLWFVGACGYTIPFLTGIFGVICLIAVVQKNYSRKKEKICLLFAISSGFLASGGALQITGCICWMYLLLVGWSIFKKKKIKAMLFAFMSTFLGAIINVVAPGNYVRQSTSYEKISIIKALYYTLIAVISELKYIFSQTYIPWLLLLLFVVACIFLKPVNEKIWHPIIVGGVVLISWLISTFPVCYGYADSALAERGCELLDIYIIIGLFLFINSVVNWTKLKGITLSKEAILIMGIFAVINMGYSQNIIPISKIPSIQCWQQIFSGELKRYHDEWIEVFNTIERSEDDIVEVPVSRWAYEADLVIMRPGMSENFENWVNNGIATYYGKEKVRVIVEDEIENDE